MTDSEIPVIERFDYGKEGTLEWFHLRCGKTVWKVSMEDVSCLMSVTNEKGEMIMITEVDKSLPSSRYADNLVNLIFEYEYGRLKEFVK